jgi:hypothetical protein
VNADLRQEERVLKAKSFMQRKKKNKGKKRQRVDAEAPQTREVDQTEVSHTRSR